VAVAGAMDKRQEVECLRSPVKFAVKSGCGLWVFHCRMSSYSFRKP